MISWLIIVTLIFLSVFISSWFWIPFTFLGIWKAGKLYFYKGRPWRRIHYPMMRLYSRVAGMETGLSMKENREFDIERALFQLIRSMKPGWGKVKIHQYIADCKIRCDELLDKKLMTDYLLTEYPSVKKDEIDNLFEKNKGFFDSSDKGILVRTAIAGIIEKKYGSCVQVINATARCFRVC